MISSPDFGLAKVYGLKDRKGAGGTPYYMAPEVLDAAPFDAKADVYAYSCLSSASQPTVCDRALCGVSKSALLCSLDLDLQLFYGSS